ncbi:MAG: acyltransferase, partial [Hyphomicrobiaceae bacterium]|nr:acyltransferase [Hyphomicrobiaceae bacterium]
MAKTSDAKLLHLESLRGIAALAVAVYHLQLGSVFNNAVTDNAWLMVDFFFVLSGYVMALNYGERITTPTEMVSFQKKRFLRLFPLHVVMLLVFLAFEVAKYFAEARSGIVANSPAFTDNNAISFVFNFLLMHNLFGAEETWNGPSWSISAE